MTLRLSIVGKQLGMKYLLVHEQSGVRRAQELSHREQIRLHR